MQTSSGIHDLNNEIEPYVEAQISNGIISGSYSIDNEALVQWQGTDPFNYTLTIDNIN